MSTGGTPIVREWEDEARVLWEADELTAAEIGAKFNVSKDTIIGIAHRREWDKARNYWHDPLVQPITLFQRLDALHARMDEVLAETASAVADRKPNKPTGYPWMGRERTVRTTIRRFPQQ